MQDGSGSRIRIENHLESGRFNLRLITNQHPLAGENGEELINIRVDAANVEDVSKIVNRRRKELKLPPLTEEQMSSVTKDIQRQQIERPEVVHTLKVDLENYRRGIAKIAYEAAHLWLGDTFLEDKRAQLLRHFILEGAEDSLAGTIGWSEEIPFGKAWSSEPDSHLVFIMRIGPSLTVGVRVFGALYAVVAVTENPELYAVPHNDNFYSWNPATQKARRGSLYEELLRQSRLQLSQTPQN
ncbi:MULTISPECIES: hypothetical protein [unclassified Rhizobium]|uniref:hypothetical protein n=1 Tax=unclassified Rhizobium TaxID=2613769 RepID=UPI001618FE24|nr:MULTISPECIES: hypothetical protein [unclassified Rhizobium]MBB3386886.1 hypothetical protein [Rhizobium sp. BK098]MBB3618539.1 hypothetical protein [Rhizobium sp. BK609]MBB3684287.1 hypothetical protein [Rhizobium sp. BK612]